MPASSSGPNPSRYLESLLPTRGRIVGAGGGQPGQIIVVAPATVQREIAEILASRGIHAPGTEARSIDTF
ncbi:MAG: hypothetical protein R3B96_17985 [Pirellulaceae bacterium]